MVSDAAFTKELCTAGWEVTCEGTDFKPLEAWVEQHQLTKLRIISPRDRLSSFGLYRDAVVREETMWQAMISPALDIGLLKQFH